MGMLEFNDVEEEEKEQQQKQQQRKRQQQKGETSSGTTDGSTFQRRVSEQESEALRDRILELERENERLMKMLIRSGDRMPSESATNGTTSTMQHPLESVATKENTETLRKVADLKADLATKTDVLKTVLGKLADAERKVVTGRLERATLNNSNEALRKDLNKFIAQRNELSSKYDGVRKHLDIMKLSMTRLSKENLELRTQMARLGQQMEQPSASSASSTSSEADRKNTPRKMTKKVSGGLMSYLSPKQIKEKLRRNSSSG